MTQVFTFTQTDQPLFENIFTHPNVLMNHVIIEPGKIFPKHPTDADVYILIVKGVLSLAVNELPVENYAAGQVVHLKAGTLSELSNASDALIELFVVKHTS